MVIIYSVSIVGYYPGGVPNTPGGPGGGPSTPT
jgi:hypothetical protein